MKLVVFGLTVSSSWGNGHATLWRGLIRALSEMGHEVVFFERDVPYYAAHRDLPALPWGELCLYREWKDALPRARRHLAEAEAAMVTSYCPDGVAASLLVWETRGVQKIFYDLDTPVTLATLEAGKPVAYLGPDGLGAFDLVLSFTGGQALTRLKSQLGARRVAPLYGSADPAAHRPVPPEDAYRSDFSYLGTYARDRQEALERFFFEPARALPSRKFLLGGSLYPDGLAWPKNVWFVHHVPPPAHPAFYCSSPLTLNITRGTMAALGYCPSGRLFEAAACGVPVLSDDWEGIERFFVPDEEIFIAHNTKEALSILALPPGELARVGAAARARTLEEHTAAHRARDLLALLESS